jgi:dTMP kinase
MFITFEGSEGSGKTSQMALLASYLRQMGYHVLATREPGGTTIGDQIRTVLVDFKNKEMQPRTEILLFQASRAQLVEQVIRPYLKQNCVVLCDRYGDSTLAYQGYGRQMDVAQLRGLVQFATGGLVPDLTLFLDVDVQVGLARRAQQGNMNRLDALDEGFYRRVRQGYLEMVQAEPRRWVIIDANQSIDTVQDCIRQVVVARIPAQASPHI